VKKRGNWIAAVGFILLGAALRAVPGIRFSSNLCFGIAGTCFLWWGLTRWAENSRAGTVCKRLFLAGVAAVILVLGCFEAVIITHGEQDRSALPVDAIIVLGAGVNGERPSLTLQTRIRAAAVYMEQHPDIPVVLSGGQGSGEYITEAECMHRELQTSSETQNRRYLLEEQSTSTAENFSFSANVLRENGIDPETAVIAVVTNDFHIARAQMIAQKQGYHAVVGVPAELPWWWLSANYYVREAFAMVKTLIFD